MTVLTGRFVSVEEREQTAIVDELCLCDPGSMGPDAHPPEVPPECPVHGFLGCPHDSFGTVSGTMHCDECGVAASYLRDRELL